MPYKLAAGRYSGAQGISSSASATTLGDSTQGWTVNAFAGFTVQSYAAGFPTRATVASNTATVLTLNATGWDNGVPFSGQPYVVSNLQGAIGHLYHAGLANGTNWYGYIFEPIEGKDGGFRERSDIAAKGQLIQYSSPNITDRDVAYWPKVSQGDFSGGMGQTVAVDFTKYWDSTLDIRTPGYLAAWPNWNTLTVQGTLVSPLNPQMVTIGGKLFITYGESNFHVYTVTPPTTVTVNTGAIIAKSIDTDGYYLYITDGTKIERRVATAFGTVITVTTTATVTAAQIWSIQQGTNGRWIFYSDQAFPQSSLYRVDLNGTLPSAGVQVPFGSNVGSIVDVVAYLNGVAILTVGGTSATAESNWDLWFFDGTNTTPIFHRDGYTAFGLCNAQEQLYVTENPSIGTYGRTQLVQISSGVANVVASLGTPPNYLNQALVGQPRAVGAQVFFATSSAAVRSIQPMYVVAFNPATGAVSHTDAPNPTPTGFRTLTPEGESIALAYLSGTVGSIQYQATGSFGAGGGASVSLVGVAGAIASGVGKVTPAFGQATSAGDLAVLTVTAGGTLRNGNITLKGVTGWIKATDVYLSIVGSAIWYKPNCAANETAPEVDNPYSGSAAIEAQLTEWAGAVTLAPLDTTGSGTAGDVGSLTLTTAGLVTAAGEVGISVFGEARSAVSTGAWTPGGGWTNLGNNHATSLTLHFASDYQLGPSSGAVLSETGSSTQPSGSFRSWAGAMAVFLAQQTPIAFGSGGKLVTSRIDFNTPGIKKRLRRLKAVHAPIPTNCSLQIDCYLDKDPAAYTVGLPADATITNANPGQIATEFFLANLIGHSAYFVLTFFSTDNVSTIVLNWISVEITTPRAWEFTFACTNVINMLTQDRDDQGVKAKDLADFFLDAWENPRRLSLFNRDGYAYTVELQSWERWNPSPKTQISEVEQSPSEEYIVKAVFSQTVADN